MFRVRHVGREHLDVVRRQGVEDAQESQRALFFAVLFRAYLDPRDRRDDAPSLVKLHRLRLQGARGNEHCQECDRLARYGQHPP